MIGIEPMTRLPSRTLLLAGLLGACACLSTAHAQGMQGQGDSAMIQTPGSAGARPVVPTQNPNAALPRRVPRPAGIPGAETDRDNVAPADRPASEMRPTEALFDAINRGDITAARDAINRGAELNGRNMLGFTPIEVAVDLSRKDIAFLLLSLRGMDSRPQGPTNPQTAGRNAAQSVAEQARAAKLEAQRQEAARRAAARVAPPQGPAAPQSPRLFAGDGGQPVPDSGFLGFGGGTAGNRGRQSGTAP